TQAKGHARELIKFLAETERRVLTIVRVDAHLIIALGEVQLGVHLCVAEFFDDFIDARHWVCIFLAHLVHWPVVHSNTNTAVLLGNRHDGRAPFTLALLDHAQLEHLLDSLLYFGLQFDWESPAACVDWPGVGLDIQAM